MNGQDLDLEIKKTQLQLLKMELKEKEEERDEAWVRLCPECHNKGGSPYDPQKRCDNCGLPSMAARRRSHFKVRGRGNYKPPAFPMSLLSKRH